jgi:hypothetical protein
MRLPSAEYATCNTYFLLGSIIENDYLENQEEDGRIISKYIFRRGLNIFSLHHRVQTGSGAHPASYPMGTSGSLPWGKAAGV